MQNVKVQSRLCCGAGDRDAIRLEVSEDPGVRRAHLNALADRATATGTRVNATRMPLGARADSVKITFVSLSGSYPGQEPAISFVSLPDRKFTRMFAIHKFHCHKREPPTSIARMPAAPIRHRRSRTLKKEDRRRKKKRRRVVPRQAGARKFSSGFTPRGI
jgi:hypothetical protein